MESQQLTWTEGVRSHPGELDQVLYFGALGGFDKILLPLNKALRDRRQKRCLLDALQGRSQCFRSIKVACHELDVGEIELGTIGRLAYKRTNALPHCGKLSDKFLSVISGSSGNQYHRL